MKLEYPEHATQIDDISGLKLSWVKNMDDLNQVESENIVKGIRKHLSSSIQSLLKWFSTENSEYNPFYPVW